MEITENDVASAEWLSSAKAAQLMGFHPSTLTKMRQEGRGPVYFQDRDGGHPRYRRADVLAWIRNARREGAA